MDVDEQHFCGETVRGAIDLVGGKWSMPILWELLQEDRRYADLRRRVGGTSQKILSGELRRLVEAGLVEREVRPTVPPQVTYRITARGRRVDAVFSALHTRGHQNLLPPRGRSGPESSDAAEEAWMTEEAW